MILQIPSQQSSGSSTGANITGIYDCSNEGSREGIGATNNVAVFAEAEAIMVITTRMEWNGMG